MRERRQAASFQSGNRSSLVVEDIFDISGAVEYANNFDRTRDDTVEKDVAAVGKALNPWSQLLPTPAQTGLAPQGLNGFVEFIDEGVCAGRAVIRNIAPDFEQIRRCSRANAEQGHLLAAFC
jgi:hypothetical protein